MGDHIEKKRKTGGMAGVVVGTTAICTLCKDEVGLTYRGYSILDLAAHSNFEEVVYLLFYGNLPSADELRVYRQRLAELRRLPDPLKDRFEGNIVEICMPDAQLKKEIVQFYLQDTECSQTMITVLMQNIKHFSGRKIKQLIDRAKRKAVIRTNDPHPELYMCDIQAAFADFNYTQSWHMWLHGNWKQIEKHGPSIITWTLTAMGLYISYCHYDKLVPLHMK